MDDLDLRWDSHVEETSECAYETDGLIHKRNLNEYFDYLLDVNPSADDSNQVHPVFKEKFTL